MSGTQVKRPGRPKRRKPVSPRNLHFLFPRFTGAESLAVRRAGWYGVLYAPNPFQQPAAGSDAAERRGFHGVRRRTGKEDVREGAYRSEPSELRLCPGAGPQATGPGIDSHGEFSCATAKVYEADPNAMKQLLVKAGAAPRVAGLGGLDFRRPRHLQPGRFHDKE